MQMHPFPNRKIQKSPPLPSPNINGSFADPQQTPVPLLLPPARADGAGSCRVSAGLQTEGADISDPQTHTGCGGTHWCAHGGAAGALRRRPGS